MFDLHSLGWHSFQQLCLTVCREVLGQTVESFLDTNDGGRDGAFSGTWKPVGGFRLEGRFVIQCKFTNRISHSLQPSDVTEELCKVEKLVSQDICDVYILLTNAGISGRTNAKIKANLKMVGVKDALIFDSTWIVQQIRESKRLRMLVPRVYGLGDLSQILDERAYSQAKAVLESLRDDLSKVVITDSYRKAAAALDEHGYVLLIGEPAAGKTTIASMLAMVAADQWSASVMKLDNPSAVVEHWNPDEPSQFFWIDDAFGVTQYEGSLVLGWNHVLPQIKAMLRRGAKVVMTSRDYIYNRARQELKEGAFPLFNEGQVVIDVHALTTEERCQILYNHMKLGRQPQDFRTQIKPYLEFIAARDRFLPEIARRLADPFFTKLLSLDEWSLGEFVDKRELLLIEVLRGLDRQSKAALAIIYMRNDRLESPIVLASSEEHALLRLNSDLGACIDALAALKGSLVVYSQGETEAVWKFKHPTIADAYAAILRDSPELLDVYVRGSAPDKLMEQVTCGSVGIEKAVVLPKSLFALMVGRLSGYSSSKQYKSKWMSSWGAKWSLHRFLTRRCSREFLAMYIATNPELVNQVSSPCLYLGSASEVGLAVRLHEFGLLPEANRRLFVEKVSEYAIQGEDVSALDDKKIQAVFTEEELNGLIEAVREELLPRLGDVREEVQNNYNHSEDDPEEHMRRYLDSLSTLRLCFGDDETRVRIEHERHLADEWISENPSEESKRPARPLGRVDDTAIVQSTRSIFDDVDS